ncbi:hypothetical protein EK0264_05825 [Epidermidibacterium keratini]|uniref:SURF1-like protein n=1 Tax=Epidermidibacterium keratini TaxID=1891644 RepID=A0A7L4YLB3_9ACTN|nr:SURF1 family protein [Epidermidibacterium keratini]QHB99847.1 hypothetical protein EK0264_05825 [Epidermidibacterium keratini]
MYRFLLSPKWIAGLLGFLLAAATMVWLGNWQLDRMHQKRAANAAITAAVEADPVPAGEVMPSNASEAVPSDEQWRKVTVTGTYLPEQMVLVRQRSFPDGVGLEIVVPMAADDGATYLISRGYVLSSGGADELPDLPQTPTGEVTVTGWVRPAVAVDSAAAEVSQIGGIDSVRRLDSQTVQDEMGQPISSGYVQATSESGDPAAIERVPLPELDDGPHLSYAIQWFLFAAITLIGFGYVARREAIDRLLADDEGWDETPTEVAEGPDLVSQGSAKGR